MKGREVSQGREAETACRARFLPRGEPDPAQVSSGPRRPKSWGLPFLGSVLGLPGKAPKSLFVGSMG